MFRDKTAIPRPLSYLKMALTSWNFSPLWLFVVLCSLGFYNATHAEHVQSPKITGIRFLLTVNDTWDPNGCITTVATDMLQPNLPLNKSRNIIVGSCDHGPLEVHIQSPGQDNCKYSAFVTFHSSVIEDASPPTCTLSWNGTYLVPKSPWKPKQDLLPSCFVMDSREGYHMTYYWFHILEWKFEEAAPAVIY